MTTKITNCISLITKIKVLMVAMIQDPKTVTIRMSDSNKPLINYFESMIKSYTNRTQKQRRGDMVFSWVQRSWWWMIPLQCAHWLAVQLSPNVLKSNIVQLSAKWRLRVGGDRERVAVERWGLRGKRDRGWAVLHWKRALHCQEGKR